MSKPKAWMSWSSGKDSAFALHEVTKRGEFEITALLTTVTETYGRVAMHAVRDRLLAQQADQLGLPLVRVNIPSPCANEVYEARMKEAVQRARREHVTHMVFGDLFLADVRQYRERMLAGTGITPIFPLWQRPTDRLARSMVASGLKAVLTCVDPRQLSPSFAGRQYDMDLLNRLPNHVDPCGERGEFHTFVYDGPMFHGTIPIKRGETVERDGFIFADVMPQSDSERRDLPGR